MLLNCDIGESFGAWTMGMDRHVMPYIDQANIACGFHAGDPVTMRTTVRLALESGVAIGARPAYPDLQGFGRRSMALHPEEVSAMVSYQIGALWYIAESEGGSLSYVKPHGALYNDMMRDPALLEAILVAVKNAPRPLSLMAMTTRDNHRIRAACGEHGVELILEAFADRAYDSHGYLVSRSQRGAVYKDRAAILEQSIRIAEGRAIPTLAGEAVVLEANSLCVHGDNPESVEVVQAIREALGARQ